MKALWNKLFVPTLVITVGFVAGNLQAATSHNASHASSSHAASSAKATALARPAPPQLSQVRPSKERVQLHRRYPRHHQPQQMKVMEPLQRPTTPQAT